MTTEYEILFAEEFFRQQAAEEKNKVFDDALVRDYEMTFSTPHGQRVMLDILMRGHLYETTFTGNSRGMFLEGQRDMALYILSYFQTHKYKERNDG
jgi:hypothetical protein